MKPPSSPAVGGRGKGWRARLRLCDPGRTRRPPVAAGALRVPGRRGPRACVPLCSQQPGQEAGESGERWGGVSVPPTAAGGARVTYSTRSQPRPRSPSQPAPGAAELSSCRSKLPGTHPAQKGGRLTIQVPVWLLLCPKRWAGPQGWVWSSGQGISLETGSTR